VLTVEMGICLALANPLLLRLGVAHGGWLELALGIALCAAVGYASGRWLAARTAAAGTWYQRGAIVADAAAAHGAQRSFHCSAAVRAASIPLLLNRGTLPPSTVARRALRSVL